MTYKQSEALRLAYIIEGNWDRQYGKQVAAELRRLHEVNAELVEALKEVYETPIDEYDRDLWIKVEAVIAKATGEQQ
jgi:hypothetical protein